MILITGAARSGTSLTCEIFEACGAEFGKTNGLKENTFVRNRIVKPYLSSIGCDPLAQNPLPLKKDLRPDPEWREKVLAGLDGVKIYKGAKMCLMWEIWHKAFPEAKWVIVRRDNEGIVDSCLRTSFMRAYNTADGWQKWLDVHLKRFEEMKQHLDVVEVWPKHFKDDKDCGCMQEAVEFCGFEWNEDAARSRINPSLLR